MKARRVAGETLFGTFLTLGSPLAAESLGLAGFDWLLVDLEHGGDESLLLGQPLGASAAGVHALVRVESDVRGRTARALDLGVEGVMCPQVNSP
jgi:2-keto-3-deoxy-L-rhamnonate aldolase RhmA